MNNLKWLSALCLTSMALACGGTTPGSADDSDTDDLSDTTYSMEMVRANPQLAPNVAVPQGFKVKGHSRPVSSDLAREQELGPVGFGFHHPVVPGDFLYTANQLGQFLQLADPTIHKDDKGDASYSRQPGDLFADDGKLVWLDVEQGHLGDCYFAASLTAVLLADNGAALTRNLITPRVSAGKVVSYYVNFFQASGRKVRVEVDPDLLHRANGHVLYMRSTQTKPGYEEWAPSLVEKAYAKWHGSYNSIGNGGTAADAIFALTGKSTRSYSPTAASTVTAIEAAGKAGRAQAACTYGDNSGVKYPTGLYADHCYTLRGIKRVGSNVFVQLRNPWGPGSATDVEPTEPPGLDGNPDALFDLPLADFQKLYASVDIVP